MDHIYIRDMQSEAIVGVFAAERKNKQPLKINLDVEVDFAHAESSDDFRNAVNYSAVEEKVHQLVSESKCFLLEKLASDVANTVLDFNGVHAVTVTIDKPHAPRHSRSIAVEMRREKR